MTGPRIALAVLRKDVLLDLRSRDRLGHMLVFSALVVVVLSIALPAQDVFEGGAGSPRGWVPVLLWIVFLFSALLGLARSFQSETEGGALRMLIQVPCDRGWIFVGKACANWLALVGVQIWTAFLATIFLDVEWWPALPAVLLIGGLGALGLSIVGTLLSAMSVAARFREFLLPVLLFPLILPVVVIASHMTAEALGGRSVPRLWWGSLALYDWAFALIAYFVFDYVLEE